MKSETLNINSVGSIFPKPLINVGRRLIPHMSETFIYEDTKQG